ncbi:PIN-like domain-containing protein [Neobacillus drentensis]|uniref:PIN-like domain-containing protein n=1 Tax=Neobacillus drentensis TaxID=220684 RepID=UPI002FFF782F
MSSKWYPNIIDIIGDSKVIFDTSALLNVYRYSLVSSKRILNHIRKYEVRIWLPSQVRKEFYRNKGSVRSINLYKNLDNKLIRHVETKKDELLVQLSEYEKKRFSKFTELKSKLEAKFFEMNAIIKAYKTDIAEETGVYKEFIEEVDSYLDGLLESDKVSEELNLVELLEVLKEGELRYKYNLPPGYEDAKSKEGIDKFGDLIMWKQVLKKSPEITEKHIIFVTSDTKPDWFHKNNQNEVIYPRKELISEFTHYNKEKEVIIIPFENFIEEISDSSDQSDRDLLLELRMSNLIQRLSQESINKIIDEKLKLVDIRELQKKAIQASSGMERQYIQTLGEISHPYIETFTVNSNGVKIEENEVIYFINIVADCEFPTVSYSSNVISYGGIHTEITLSVELKRKIVEGEVTFLSSFKENPFNIATVTHFIFDKVEYIWGSDDDHSEEYEDDVIEKGAYTTCPSCGRGITNSNDAGNGFCIHCPQ